MTASRLAIVASLLPWLVAGSTGTAAPSAHDVRDPAATQPATPVDEELLRAAENEDLDAARRAIARGANLNAVGTRRLSTPLDVAARFGSMKVAKLLIEKGADLNATGKAHGSPLITALIFEHHEIAELLVQSGADIHLRDRNLGNALHVAARAGDLEIVKYLVERGLDLADAKVNCGGAPLSEAAEGDHVEVMDYLLSKGAAIEQEGDGGATALIAAAACGRLNAIKFLVEHGADVNARGCWLTALQFAERRGFYDVARFLKEHGAKK